MPAMQMAYSQATGVTDSSGATMSYSSSQSSAPATNTGFGRTISAAEVTSTTPWGDTVPSAVLARSNPVKTETHSESSEKCSSQDAPIPEEEGLDLMNCVFDFGEDPFRSPQKPEPVQGKVA